MTNYYYIWQVMPMCMVIAKNEYSLGMENLLWRIPIITDLNYSHNVFGVFLWNRLSMLYIPLVVVGGVAVVAVAVAVVETAADDAWWMEPASTWYYVAMTGYHYRHDFLLLLR